MPVEVYADCADLADMERWAEKVSGFTTNPSLARAAGVTDYMGFCRDAVKVADGKPVSLEVVTRTDVEREARVLADLGPNVWVKVPWTETGKWMRRLQVNVTGVFSSAHVLDFRDSQERMILSVFAGRIADTGRDPHHIVKGVRNQAPWHHKVLWASAREVLNIRQAQKAGADIITLGPALLAKLDGLGRDLHDYSLETITQFYADAEACGYVISA